LADGAEFVRRFTTVGVHDVSIEVSDGFETCRDVITVIAQ
jgi:hypothetical protein